MKKFPRLRRAFIAGILLGGGFLGGGIVHAGNAAPNANYSAPTLYNLGNQAARAGNPAAAVLDYERAGLLAPNDADIRTNLRVVQESARISPQQVGWLARHDRLAAPNLMYWVGMLGLLLGGGALLAHRLRVPGRKPLAALATIGAAMVMLSIGDAVALIPALNEAVVMRVSPASVSPVAGADAQFTVPAAEIVQIRDHHQGFLLIRDSQNREGWIPAANAMRVIPAEEPRSGQVIGGSG